ncbi:MAG: PAS domain S-box protein [Thiobacillaceae bacterium]
MHEPDIKNGSLPAKGKYRLGASFFRLFLLLFIPAALLILACAWYVGHDRIEGELGLIQSEEINNLVLGVRRLDGELRVPLRHLHALANADAVRQAINNSASTATGPLETAFLTLIAYNPMYDQVRWIDETGMERVRVNNVAGHPAPVARNQLQNKADRYYFTKTMQLQPGQIFISPLDLNVEHGQVEVPYKPMLRLATPVQDENGKARGILIVNVAATHLLDDFTESMGNKRDHVMLVNKEGYWLKSPNPADEWGFMFNRAETLGKRFPAIWKIISSRPADQVELDDGLWTWSSFYPLKFEDNRDINDIPQWLIVSHLPANQLALIRGNVWQPITVVSLTVIATLCFLTAWLALAVTGRNQARVDAAKAQAEAAGVKNLSQAQERYSMVVKANVNGLLVVDTDGRIVLTNPALERMFGYTTDELLGQPLETLVPEAKQHQHLELRTSFMREPAARPMGMGRVLSGRRKDGSVFPLEVSLSPFSENDKQYVGAIVSDMSPRD